MEPEWLTTARAEGRIKETAVNMGKVASDATTRTVKPSQEARDSMSEKTFDALVVGIALANGWESYHTHDSRRSEDGFPDRVFVRGVCLVFAELKKEAGEPTAAQLHWLEILAKTGNEAYLWRPSNWDAIVKRLTQRE